MLRDLIYAMNKAAVNFYLCLATNFFLKSLSPVFSYRHKLATVATISVRNGILLEEEVEDIYKEYLS